MRVLLVDDDPDLLELVGYVLESGGDISVRRAASAAEALDAAGEERPDVVLMDVTMPGMDGFAALARMRAGELRTIPVLLMTAKSPSPELTARCLGAGAVGLLEKPIDPFTLPDRLRKILAER